MISMCVVSIVFYLFSLFTDNIVHHFTEVFKLFCEKEEIFPANLPLKTKKKGFQQTELLKTLFVIGRLRLY